MDNAQNLLDSFSISLMREILEGCLFLARDEERHFANFTEILHKLIDARATVAKVLEENKASLKGRGAGAKPLKEPDVPGIRDLNETKMRFAAGPSKGA